MLTNKEEVVTFEQAGDEVHVSITRVNEPSSEVRTQASEEQLFEIYERIAETRPGTRDAEIFAKIREWVYSDFGQ